MAADTRMRLLRPASAPDFAKSLLDTRWLALLFVVFALATGLRLALLTPIDQVADEQAHIARAAGLSTGQVFGQRGEFTNPGPGVHAPFAISGVMVNIGLVAASSAEHPPGSALALSARRLHAAEAIKWSNGMMLDLCPNTVQYFPLFYLPGTIGIGAGRLIGLSPLNAMYAGRVMMLLAYVTMGTLALCVTSWGRGLLFAMLLLPMAISLGASFNQDGQLLAATALAGALLTKDPLTAPRQRVAAIILLVLLICSKPPYGLLLFAGMVPLTRPEPLKRLMRLSLFAIPPIVWVVIMATVSMVTFHRTAYHPGPLWPGSKSILFHSTSAPDNLRVLLAAPTRLITMPIELLMQQFSNFLNSAIGVLGWLSVMLQPWQYRAWEIAVVCAALGVICARSRWQVRPIDSLLIVTLIVSTVFAISLAQYLSWTTVGAAAIDGVTGRYFLLFLPFVMLALPRLGHRIDTLAGSAGVGGMIEGLLAVPAIFMAAYDVFGLPSLVARLFQT